MSTVTQMKDGKGTSGHKAQAKAEKLPKPPKDPNAPKKVVKPWIGKRQDNAMRALRALTFLTERLTPARTEGREEFAVARDIYQTVADARGRLEAAVKGIVELGSKQYKPLTEKTKLEVGALVWIKGGVWRKKYHGLYKPEEMNGLKVVSMTADGKIVRARTEDGSVQVTEPSGIFKTTPVDYVKASEETEAA